MKNITGKVANLNYDFYDVLVPVVALYCKISQWKKKSEHGTNTLIIEVAFTFFWRFW